MTLRKTQRRVVRLAFTDSAEARLRLVKTLRSRGLFIPAPEPETLGVQFPLRLTFQDGQPAASGWARVTEHARVGQARGYFVKYVELDSGALHPAALEAGPPPPPPTRRSPITAPLPRVRPSRVPEGARPTLATPTLSSRGCALAWVPPPSEDAAPPSADALEPEAQAEPEEGLSEAELLGEEQGPSWQGGLRPLDTFSGYQLLKRLGAGGMAEVFLARHLMAEGVEKLVALKFVSQEYATHPALSELFFTEARVSATLQHPNVIQVFDMGAAAGRPFIAMEYVHGRNGAELIQALRERRRPPPVALGVALAIELCKALEYLHDKRDLDGRPLNLVHRDVSPSNLLVSLHGAVKLVDMGVAAASIASESNSLLVGKLAYMSPEQATGLTPQPCWDLYGVGLVLYELLTLERAFASHSDPAALLASRRARLRPSAFNPQVSSKLEEVVQWATEFERSRRAPSARALRLALERVQVTLPPFDVVRTMQQLFGRQLEELQHETEALISTARQKDGASAARAHRRLASAVQRLVPTRVKLVAARHQRALRWGALALGLLLTVGGALLWRVGQREAALREHLRRADEYIASARLVGAGSDTALAQLRAARELGPEDARVRARLASLADTFQRLGEVAEGRGDATEALGHFRAALEADGARTVLRARIRALEDELRASSHSGRVAP